MPSHVVIDGSNIATEGRKLPSLEQLIDAVDQFTSERPHDIVTVVCDASFPNRIDGAEAAKYEQLVDDGWLLTPPAGAIGRGDAFILQVAAKASANILSNDSFQEFHGEHPWLFEEGRLVGGKPVLGVGWVFVDRLPVRGPTSRRAVREAKEAETSEAATSGETNGSGDGEVTRRVRRAPGSASFSNPRNAFRAFAKEHGVGSHITAPVEGFSSHGAYARFDDLWCYVPLRSLGDPPPRRARDVLTIGEEHDFVVTELHEETFGIDVTLATGAAVDDRPARKRGAAQESKSSRPAKRTRKRTASLEARDGSDAPAATSAATASDASAASESGRPAVRRRRAGAAATSGDDAPSADQPVTKRTTRRAATPTKTAASKKAAAAKKAPSTRKASAAKKAPAAKKAAAAKKAPAARKTTSRKAPAAKKTAAPKNTAAAKKSAPAAKSSSRSRTASQDAKGTTKRAATAKKQAPRRRGAAPSTATAASGRPSATKQSAPRKSAATKSTTRKATPRRTTGQAASDPPATSSPPAGPAGDEAAAATRRKRTGSRRR